MRAPLLVPLRHVAACAVALCVVATCAACGKRRPPLPPIERIPQRTELLSGTQQGTKITLRWPLPGVPRNSPEPAQQTSVLQSVRRIDVYRLAESPAAPLPLTEAEFAARATVIGSLTQAEIEQVVQANQQTLHYTDALDLGGASVRLRYALRYVNRANQRAAFSNFFLIEPAPRVSQPPVITDVAATSETAVTIRWQPPQSNIDGSTPVNLLGYNIYRFTSESTGSVPLNSSLVTATEFVDGKFSFGTTYTYLARAVSLGPGGASVESLDSNPLSFTPRDVFAPSVPGRITAVAVQSQVSLFFPANPESDVIGYIIYRSVDPALPPERWTKLTDQPLERTTYVDAQVEPGVRYHYYLIAVDRVGNTSPASAVTSELVPERTP